MWKFYIHFRLLSCEQNYAKCKMCPRSNVFRQTPLTISVSRYRFESFYCMQIAVTTYAQMQTRITPREIIILYNNTAVASDNIVGRVLTGCYHCSKKRLLLSILILVKLSLSARCLNNPRRECFADKTIVCEIIAPPSPRFISLLLQEI